MLQTDTTYWPRFYPLPSIQRTGRASIRCRP